jgi:hypothetical protein
MPTPADYRKHALDCRQLAAATADRFEREALLRMAEQWTRLAEHKARKEAEEA